MNNSQVIPMRKRVAFATAVVFAVAIMITSIFNVFILIAAAVVAQTQPINTASPSQGTNSLSLSDIYSEIAVLQISQNASQPQRQLLSSLKPLALGNSSNVEVVDTVIAIGNPFGLSDAMTTGLVSGIGRSIPIAC
jgi:S1-C subfamily serine protease